MVEQKTISWEDFEKVDIRVGRIVAVSEFPEARKPAYKLQIDFGQNIGIKNSSAQLTKTPKDKLLGLQVAAVVNFAPKQIGKFISEVLTLGFADNEGEWVVISPLREVVLGGKLQ